jgi:hypothetical protein
MPIHDWMKVEDALFHDFQLSWASKLAEALNSLLPSSHFAVTETFELRPPSPFPVWPEPDRPVTLPPHYGAVRDDLPRTQFTVTDDRRQYARVAVGVRHADHHQPQAAVLWVTGQDKQTPWRFRSLLDTVTGAVTRNIPLLLIDLFPPSPRDPNGIAEVIREELSSHPIGWPRDKPFTLVSYQCFDACTTHLQRVAVGEVLPDMPLFLDSELWVPVPLEVSYTAAWHGCARWALERTHSPA